MATLLILFVFIILNPVLGFIFLLLGLFVRDVFGLL